MRARHKSGSVVYDRRRKTWNYLWCEDGKRRSRLIGTKREFPTKSAAWTAAESLRSAPAVQTAVPTVSTLVEQYRAEKMPQRFSTRRSYNAWFDNHVLPRWGECSITDVQPRPVEMWLQSLELAPKSLVHIRGLLRTIWDYAQWRGDVPTQRNPMELVTVKGATKRTHQPRSLTVEEFQQFAAQLSEPVRTIALLCVCLGLRISECLALRWADVDWLQGQLTVERGIVRQIVADTKTETSRRQISVDGTLLTVLKTWKQTTEFSAPEDWMFASPAQIGRLPWSYPRILQMFYEAGKAAGIGRLSTHTMRHTYRSWLDAAGTSVAVQQKCMRHASITTTMNIYGRVITNEEQEANAKVAGMALTDRAADRIFCK